jgi:thiol-disulfide isomerase/thioredoxin
VTGVAKTRLSHLVGALLLMAGGTAASEGVTSFTPYAEPVAAPDVAIAALSGEAVRLDEFRGRPVLLNFWATWCAPCIREMPSLDRLQAALGGGAAILAVSEDRGGAEAVGRFLAKVPLAALTPYLDRQGALSHALEVRGLPATFLIDPEGRIRGRLDGAAEWDAPAMAALIRGYAAPGAATAAASATR